MAFVESEVADFDTVQWEVRVGAQVRSLRLESDLDQHGLAALADISVSALKNLETGRGTTLRTLIRTLRALHAESWLDTLAPEPTVSPLDTFRGAGQSPRQRVYRPRRAGA